MQPTVALSKSALDATTTAACLSCNVASIPRLICYILHFSINAPLGNKHQFGWYKCGFPMAQNVSIFFRRLRWACRNQHCINIRQTMHLDGMFVTDESSPPIANQFVIKTCFGSYYDLKRCYFRGCSGCCALVTFLVVRCSCVILLSSAFMRKGLCFA